MTAIKTKIIRKETYKRVEANYRRALQMAVFQSAAMVRETAVQSVASGAKSGITYEKYNPRRTHIASAPGQAPATDTGYLLSNIVHQIDSDGLGASIESRADYSAALEFGTSKMQARPFLHPAIEENRPKIKRLIAKLAKGAN